MPLQAEYAASLLDPCIVPSPNLFLLSFFGHTLQVPLLAEYAASLRTKIIQGVDHPTHRDTPLKGLKIVVDAGNGSGGFFAEQVRSRVGGREGWVLTRQELQHGRECARRVCKEHGLSVSDIQEFQGGFSNPVCVGGASTTCRCWRPWVLIPLAASTGHPDGSLPNHPRPSFLHIPPTAHSVATVLATGSHRSTCLLTHPAVLFLAASCAPQVLAPLGADTAGSRYLDPDGSFPNHIPNPEAKEAMASAVEAVKEAGGWTASALQCRYSSILACHPLLRTSFSLHGGPWGRLCAGEGVSPLQFHF